MNMSESELDVTGVFAPINLGEGDRVRLEKRSDHSRSTDPRRFTDFLITEIDREKDHLSTRDVVNGSSLNDEVVESTLTHLAKVLTTADKVEVYRDWY